MAETARLLEYHDLITSVIAALDARDTYTASHSFRVAELTQQLCGFLSLSEQENILIHIAAHLHDIGKIGIPDAILQKDGPLTDEEWLEARKHPIVGYDILHTMPVFYEVAQIVRHHHERWDSTGYPYGLLGKQIPLGSRIIAVADSMDAMMSSRSYRPGMSPEQCQEEIKRNAGKMYDPAIAEAALCHWQPLLDCWQNCKEGRSLPAAESSESSSASQQEMRIGEIYAYLTGHMEQRLTIAQICSYFHTSSSWLKGMFKESYGMPINTYMRNYRIQEACRLLQSTPHSVAEIAQMVGYESQSRFSAVFKARIGVSPSTYRKEKSKLNN